MRQLVTAVFALAVGFSPTAVLGQNCKPDVSGVDRISKQPVEAWMQVLNSTSFAGKVAGSTDVVITAVIGRMGTVNELDLRIQKKEESATKIAFESAYRATIGKPFLFGFKDGDPVEFVVTDVSNDAKVQAGIFADKGVTTVVLSAVLSDQTLAKLRDALLSRQIDGVRVPLAGGVQIDKAVDDKNGKKMMAKFSCFYESLDKRGIDLSAGSEKTRPARPASASDSIEQRSKPQLTIDQVIQMVNAKVADDIIISSVRNSNSTYDLTPDALIKLKTAGVSDAVIRAMSR